MGYTVAPDQKKRCCSSTGNVISWCGSSIWSGFLQGTFFWRFCLTCLTWRKICCRPRYYQRNYYNFLMKRRKELAKPRKSYCFLVSRVGQSLITWLFAGSALTCPPSRRNPRKVMDGTWNLNFSALTCRRFTNSLWSTRQMWVFVFLQVSWANENIVKINKYKFM